MKNDTLIKQRSLVFGGKHKITVCPQRAGYRRYSYGAYADGEEWCGLGVYYIENKRAVLMVKSASDSLFDLLRI